MRRLAASWARGTVSLCAILFAQCSNDRPLDDDIGASEEGLFTSGGTLAADATIFAENTNNGGGYPDICIGNSPHGVRRSLIRYNLPAIPAGSTITRVRVSFTQTRVAHFNDMPPANIGATMRMRRVNAAWTEGSGNGSTHACGGQGDASGVAWAGPAVAGADSAQATLTAANGFAFTVDSNTAGNGGLVADVQAWLDGTATNNGWRLATTDEAAANARAMTVGAISVSWRVSNATTCTQDDDCASFNCIGADDLDCAGRGGCVCCSAATCNGACESCRLGGSVGTCSPRPVSTVCRNASCGGGSQTLSTNCNGVSHACPAATVQPCAPFVCDTAACFTMCSSNAQCLATSFCNSSNVCEVITDECAQALDDCDRPLAMCNDPTVAVGDFTCMCIAGYSGSGHGAGSCVDNDECVLGTNNCDVNATCTNTPGSFTCACNGPQWVGDGVVCMDYNECMDPFYTSMCDPNAMCNNLVPGFQCICNAGYQGTGFMCVDIDECMTGANNCSPQASCTNLPGTFSCACNMGFSGDGVTCVDIDECLDTAFTSRCASVARCNNLFGSWECICNAGYRGDGFTCADIDECAENMDDCNVNATCSNTVGSFSCLCNAGYRGSGVDCQDINECLEGTAHCANYEVCVNHVGTPFTCDCAPGYMRPAGGGACAVVCGDGTRGPGEACDDGNTTAGDGCSAICVIEPGWTCYEPTAAAASICSDTCGNGTLEAGEQCDNGATNSDTVADACRRNCRRASCGDRVTDNGEVCDDGAANSDTTANACRANCQRPFCGDGVVDTGESCDPGGGTAGGGLAGMCTTRCVADSGIDPNDPPVLTGGACGCRAVGGRSPLAFILVVVAVVVLRRRRERTRLN